MSSIPVLGVCLGHQLLGLLNGCTVERAPLPVHGQVDLVYHSGTDMFMGIPSPFQVVRYHSLVVVNKVPSNSNVLIVGKSKDDLIMGIVLTNRNAWGVQFHPESICTEFGSRMLLNFFNIPSNLDAIFETPTITTPFWWSASPSLESDVFADMDDKYTITVKQLSSNLLHPECVFRDFFHADDGSSFWLDSSDKDSKSSRFSFMGNGAGPHSKVIEFFVSPEQRSFHEQNHETCAEYILRESKGDQVQTSRVDIDIFDFLDQSIQALKANTCFIYDGSAASPLSEWDLPFGFACGHVGFLGYGLRKLCGVKATMMKSAPIDMRRKMSFNTQPLPAHSTPSRPQAAGGDEFVPESCFMFVDRMLVWDHATSFCYLVALHNENESSDCYKLQNYWIDSMIENLAKVTSVSDIPTACPGTTSPLQPSCTDEEYKCLVQSCIEQIYAGETYEVCLTRQLTSSHEGLDSLELYSCLRSINPAPYAAFFKVQSPAKNVPRTSDFSICCSSPERFMCIDATGKIESKPIKGTIRRGQTQEEDMRLIHELQNSKKDRSENLMITDLVRNDIGKVCVVGSVTVPSLMEIESFSSVHQMVTTVHGTLEPHCSPLEAVRAAFPGGSMTGAPKLRTMQIIDSLETHERGVYSGALGWISLTGALDLNIVIRTAVVTPSHVSVGTGGAIVALSDPQEEVDETTLKALRLQSALSNFI